MNVDRAFQQSVRLPCEHESAEDLHEFAAFGSEEGSTQDAVVRSIDDNLHEAGGLATFDSTGYIGHGASADFWFETFGAGFLLGHANAAELRIGENAGRNEAIFNREIFPFHQIAVNNLEIVVGNVRESGAALAIAEGPDAGNIGLEPAVHFDVAAL